MITIITKIEIGDSEGLSFTDVGHKSVLYIIAQSTKL